MTRSSLPVRLVGSVLAAAATLLPALPARGEDLRLNHDVVPVSQSVSLRLDAGTADYSGSTTIDLEVRKETGTFRFHAEKMDLDHLHLTGKDGPVPVSFEVGEKGTVTVTAARKLANGAYRLEIAFRNNFNTDAAGLYRMDKDGVGYAFTQFEADDAREAFPCWDEPGFKLPYQMTLSVPEAHLAIANTLPEKETIENGWKTITFRKTRPLPSYLLAIATGPLETVDIPNLGVPARVVTVKGQSQLATAALETTGPLLRALEAYFGGPYPYDKLDLIAVPEYWAGAMENPGAITYSDNILLLDPQATTLNQKRMLARVTAHELAHMWFGDLVTMTWWDDLWLNESFADWMGDKITHQVYPEFKWDLSALGGTLGVMSNDARPSTSAIRRPIEATDNLFENLDLAYAKGRAVLGMFEQWVGPETFRRGVLAYLEAHAWGNATADDLWRELDKASGKKLSEAMAGFIDQPGLPLVEVTSVSGSKVTLSQHRFRVLGVEQEDLAWRIPVGLKVGRGDEQKTETVLLDAAEKTFDLGIDVEWVLPNAGSDGYYRWAVPPKMLDEISSRALQVLTPRERIGLVSNSGALMAAGTLGGDDYLRTLSALAVDPEPLVLGSLLDALEGVKMALIPPEEETAFAAYVRHTFGPALERTGLETSPGEHETLSLIRPRLIAWLGDEGKDPGTLAFAGEKCRAYLADPASVDPALVPVVLRLAAHEGDSTLYQDFKKRAENAANPGLRQQFLGTLGSFRNPELRAATLRYSAEGSIRPNEIFEVTGGIMETEEGREIIYRWVTGNYDAITGRLPQEFASYLPFVAAGCSRDRLAAARIFFSDPKHQAPGIDRQLAKVGDQVTECVDLREREGAAVARYLETFSERR